MKLVQSAALLLCAGLLCFSACTATELHRGNGEEPYALDPNRARSVGDMAVIDDLFQGLTRFKGDGSIAPGIAESWTMSADGRVYLFHLRATARWSDGVPVTAEDFVYSWRRLLTLPGADNVPRALALISGADAVRHGDPQAAFGAVAKDPATLEVTLVSPQSHFTDLLASILLCPVPRHRVEQLGAAWTTPGAMVSDGAYRLVEWTPQVRIVLEKSPTYWDAASVKIDRVIYYPIEDPATEFKLFQTGRLDITAEIPLASLSTIKATLPKLLVSAPISYNRHLVINLDSPAWTRDANIRRALSLAIDRPSIANKVLGGAFDPADTYVPAGLAGYVSPGPPDWPAQQTERDAEAKRLWALPGQPRPRQVTIDYTTSVTAKLTLLAIAAMWHETLGIDVTLNPLEKKEQGMRLQRRDYMIAFRGWTENDPADYLDRFATNAGPMNYPDYASPAFDQLLARSRATSDDADRLSLLAQAETRLLRDAAVIPISWGRANNLVAAKVKGFVSNAFELHPTRELEIAE